MADDVAASAREETIERRERRYLCPVELAVSDIRRRTDRARGDSLMTAAFAGIAAVASVCCSSIADGPAWMIFAVVGAGSALVATSRHEQAWAGQAAISGVENRLSAAWIGRCCGSDNTLGTIRLRSEG